MVQVALGRPWCLLWPWRGTSSSVNWQCLVSLALASVMSCWTCLASPLPVWWRPLRRSLRCKHVYHWWTGLWLMTIPYDKTLELETWDSQRQWLHNHLWIIFVYLKVTEHHEDIFVHVQHSIKSQDTNRQVGPVWGPNNSHKSFQCSFLIVWAVCVFWMLMTTFQGSGLWNSAELSSIITMIHNKIIVIQIHNNHDLWCPKITYNNN